MSKIFAVFVCVFVFGIINKKGKFKVCMIQIGSKKPTSELWMIWPIWPFSMSEMLCQCRRFAGTKGGSC